MKPTRNFAFSSFLIGTLLFALPAHVYAWEPNAKDLKGASSSGDFGEYLNNVSGWLNRKTPAKPSEAALASLLVEPAFAHTLAERQLIAKTGANKLNAFTKADPSNAAFMSWLLKNTQAMNL